MAWKAFFATFLAIFFAEIGDKTQLAIMGLSVQYKAKLWVFLGASSALILSSALAALLGEWLLTIVPAALLQRCIGVLFLGLGITYLWRF